MKEFEICRQRTEFEHEAVVAATWRRLVKRLLTGDPKPKEATDAA